MSVTVRVPAKINLQLAVGPPRPDGYHGLVTVFHAVSLFDEITVTSADRDSAVITGEGAREVPDGPDNLALRAATALRAAVTARGLGTVPPEPTALTVRPEATGPAGLAAMTPVRMAITKRIPVAAGLAGGSADAAAALVACNELWRTGLSVQELSEVAARVGSDVAFALIGGTAVGRGRGEILTPALVSQARYHWVLAMAAGSLATPEVYRTLDRLREGKAAREPELSNELMGALRAGDVARLGRALANDLQAPAISLFPALRKTLAAGREFGALGALVSGSGPTCVFLARDAGSATDLTVALSGAGVARSVARATGPVPGASVITEGA